MTAGNSSIVVPEKRSIEYLSPPAQVRMANDWFEVANLDHFWVERRFAVTRALAGELVFGAAEVAEVGCGSGLLQRQIEDYYKKPVTGFDLNERALKSNISRISRVCCYDIHEQAAEFRRRFQLIFLFDVLEHIPEETRFLQSVAYHLAPQGKLVLNLPAGQWAFSEYDRANGHVCRYSIDKLRESARAGGFKVQVWTYWGLPFVPMVAARKVWLSLKRNPSLAVSTGFDSRSEFLNVVFRALGRCETLPQHFLGTSLLAVLEPR